MPQTNAKNATSACKLSLPKYRVAASDAVGEQFEQANASAANTAAAGCGFGR
jgi:hypothetical protein